MGVLFPVRDASSGDEALRSRDADRHQRGRRIEPQLPGETFKLECFEELNCLVF
jgi:hypothetical protein